MNDDSESGIRYDDVPYSSYEFPVRYRNLIRTGERFVYYRGRRRAGGAGRQPQAYLGAGLIGAIRASSAEGRLVCEIVEPCEFAEPLFFRDLEGRYREPGGDRRGFFQAGVRRIDEQPFQDILRGADAEVPAATTSHGPIGYASPVAAHEVELYSREVVMRSLKPVAEVREMPYNNPGYDIAVEGLSFKFVEVKGTQRPTPSFFMTEGERLFGTMHEEVWRLACVYGIDLESGSHRGTEWYRRLEDVGPLTPVQWACRPSPGAGSGDPS